MLLKSQKIELVQKIREEMKNYSLVGIMPISSIPDRLLQKARNGIKQNAKVIVAKKNILKKAFEGDEVLEKLYPYIEGNVALILANGDPFELNKLISGYKIKLGAKPGQISPADIKIEPGETNIPPGPAVTTLKAAGIDTQIQKGKVVIAKGKILVKKGEKISAAVARALKMLDVMPFEASARLNAVTDGRLLYTEDVLCITQEMLVQQILNAFNKSYLLTVETGYVTGYNIALFLRNAYLSAFGLGLATKAYEPGIIEQLLAEGMREALALNTSIKDDAQQAQEEKE